MSAADRGQAGAPAEGGVEGVWAIVVAAGAGSRFGSAKQFRTLGGRPVLDRAVERAARRSEGVVVVVPAARAADTESWAEGLRASLGAAGRGRGAELSVVAGGASRSESVRCGLAQVPDGAEVVLVHDAARPLADDGTFGRVIAAVRDGSDAAIPVVDVTDTVRWRHGQAADRQELVAVQTPQGFRADALREAHATGADATDDATLVESSGGRVVTVAGDTRNLKITAPHDLAVAEALLALEDGPGGAPHIPVAATADLGLRVGQGFDVHRYSDDPGRALVLGGLRFDGDRGLEGHSDADAVAHACIDALLAAAGLGDIGQLFSDADPQWAGADSLDLLSRAAAAVREAGWAPVNVSCTVVLDAPKIAPHREAMQSRLSEAAGAPVTVTGRRTEGVGALGRGEGVAAWAVALVSRRPGDAQPAGS